MMFRLDLVHKLKYCQEVLERLAGTAAEVGPDEHNNLVIQTQGTKVVINAAAWAAYSTEN